MPENRPSKLEIRSELRRPFTGRAFKRIDPKVPYYALVWYSVLLGGKKRANEGVWTDLRPDLVVDVPNENPSEVVGLEPRPDTSHVPVLHDGPVRDQLEEWSVAKWDWENATPEVRRRVKSAIRAVIDIHDAVMAAFESDQPAAQGRALRLLDRMSETVRKDRDSKDGFKTFANRETRITIAKRLEIRLVQELEHIKAQAKASRRSKYLDDGWLGAKTAHINQVLVRYGGAPAGTNDDVANLATESALIVARRLILRAKPDISNSNLARRRRG